MGQPYVGEIRMFGGNFPPNGWMTCDGQVLPISENDVLFNLIGTTYGGDGQSTFALPNLSGRIPIHMGQGPGLTQNYTIGQLGGVSTVTLNANQIPTHTHAMICSTNIGTAQSPSNAELAQSTVGQMYFADVTDSNLAANSVGTAGGGQPHENVQPFLAFTYIISLFGIFPSQN
jgi:microcystin-dependent protein